ncbi:monocarboxylate transporter [Plakobranchus ocellatus]|uniref:Monocarboxylate transporter n=1 Tax=Plakobranchus ocellatus TaxID=259542 RepID=A0AAV3Y459_9GAST|nr:monocarboxylate transporter [Plakobranchus ocellatus]
MPAVDGALSAPDGGYGWVIVFSSFFIHFMCNGLSLAMGVLCVPWYQEFNSTKTETSWIVSVMVAVMLAMGPFASSLANRIGYRAMAMVGACFLTVGCLLSCIADSILTLMLTLGVIGVVRWMGRSHVANMLKECITYNNNNKISSSEDNNTNNINTTAINKNTSHLHHHHNLHNHH